MTSMRMTMIKVVMKRWNLSASCLPSPAETTLLLTKSALFATKIAGLIIVMVMMVMLVMILVTKSAGLLIVMVMMVTKLVTLLTTTKRHKSHTYKY